MDLGAKEPQSETFAKFYFLLQGAGTLISWNAVLNGLDYFTDKFQGYNANTVFSIVVNLAQVICNLFMPFLSKVLPLKYRIIVPLVILSVILIFLPVEANLLAGGGVGFGIMLVLLFILGFANNIYQSSSSGFVGQFPFKYISFFLQGTGYAGLIMNALRAIAILTLSGPGVGPLTEIIVYFVVAGLILMVCGVMHPIFRRSYFCRYYLGELESTVNQDYSQTNQLLNSDTSVVKTESKGMKTTIEVLKVVYPFVLVLVFNYIETFITFPGVMLQKPMNMDPDWAVVSMLTVFNIFDVVGKNIAQYRKYYTFKVTIFVLIGRILVNVFFFLQADAPNAAVLNTLWFGYINVALSGCTNGFLTTAMFIMGPENVEGNKKEMAGFLSVFGLASGITIGSFIALPFNHS